MKSLLFLALVLLPGSASASADDWPLEAIAGALNSADSLMVARAQAALDRLDDTSLVPLRELLSEPLSVPVRAILSSKLAAILAGALSDLDASVIDFAAARSRARVGADPSAETRAARESARLKVLKIEQQLRASDLHLAPALTRHADLHGTRSSLVLRVHGRLRNSLRTDLKQRWPMWPEPQRISRADLRIIGSLLPATGEAPPADAIARRAALLAIEQLESLDPVQIVDARDWLLDLGVIGQQALDSWVSQVAPSSVAPGTRREWSIRNRLRLPAAVDPESSITLAGWDQLDAAARLDQMIRLRSVHGDRTVPTLVHLARTDEDPLLRRRSAELLSLLGDPRAAAILLDQRRYSADRIEEEDRDSMLRAAANLRDSGDLEGAFSLLNDLALRLTADAEVHQALGVVAMRMRNFERAVQELERSISLDPSDSSARYNLACALALSGSLEAALEALQGAVKAGYSDHSHASEDPDLEALRGLPAFDGLLLEMSRS
ncbi:MAG: tetratricopeptide repeat protein [Planctomycetota bacterium]|nr:tetratricopeptide repeat protein [Planctomycetota bacterium]